MGGLLTQLQQRPGGRQRNRVRRRLLHVCGRGATGQPGSQLNLSSLDFNSARGGGDPATQNRGFPLFAESDGGTFDLTDTPVLSVPNETGTRTAPVARSANLSGAAFQGINSVTFRYYPLTPANGNTMDYSGMTLNGQVVVPEPTALGLRAIGAVALLRRRRA